VIEKAKKTKKSLIIIGNGIQLKLPFDLFSENVEKKTFKFNILRTIHEEKTLGQFITPGYEFTLTDEDGVKVDSLAKSMVISFAVDSSKFKNPSDAQLYLFNEVTQRWEYVTGHLDNGSMTASVTQFAKYAVFETHRTFADIQGHWAQKEIENMAVRQIVAGTTDTTFEPNAKVTRAQFVTLLARALKLHKTTVGNQFTDIPVNSWYADSVNAAYEAKIVNGVDDGKFGPNDLITREQMATLLVKAYLYASGKQLPMPAVNDGIPFTDAADISDWAKENVKISSDLGLMVGVNGAFNPAAPATRAQSAAVIYRLLNL
jgi:hypothetical protein